MKKLFCYLMLASILQADQQTPWTSDIDSAGFNLILSGSIVDTNNTIRFAAELLNGNSGRTYIRDAQGNYVFESTQDGTNAGTIFLRDSAGMERVVLEQSGTNTGRTYIKDGQGTTRILMYNDSAGFGKTYISDGAGLDRIRIESFEGTLAGGIDLVDAANNVRFQAYQNGDNSGATYIFDGAGSTRFVAESDGVGGGDTTFHDASFNPRLIIHTNSVEVVGPLVHGTNTYSGSITDAPTNPVTPVGYMPITNAGVRYYVPLFQ